MTPLILQSMAAVALLVGLAWLEVHHAGRVLRALAPARLAHRDTLLRVFHTIAGAAWLSLALYLLVEPWIAGTALVDVTVPRTIPTVRENLRVRAEPIGYLGPAGGTRTITVPFNTRGIATLEVPFSVLETRLRIDVLDQSQADPIVSTTTVHVSPFVRTQLLLLHIAFDR
jgi:hypothetical protein